jgi:LysM repeat protein
MNKTIKTAFLVVMIASFVFATGCNLKASTVPTVMPTVTSELNFITPTAGGQSITNQIATQTAAAGKPAVATATKAAPEGAKATATPVAVKPTTAPAVVANTATSAPTAVPTAVKRPDTYTIQRGEWPICIARRYNLNLAAFFALNGADKGMNWRPSVGAVVKIPATGTWDTANGARALHTHADYKVVSGDTVYTIACYFGDVTPEGILTANGLAKDSDVKAGATLKIP